MQIHKNVSIKNLNNLRLEVKTKYLIKISDSSQIQELIENDTLKNETKLVLGGGCNIVFTKDFDGVVIKSALLGLKILEETEEYVVIESGSGVNWDSLVSFTIENNYGGIENMVSIPGEVGAAPVQNLAAYGQNFSDVFLSLDAVNLSTGETIIFSKEMCGFTYRDSLFKRDKAILMNHFITKVRVKLAKNPSLNTTYWSHKHGSVSEELDKCCLEPYTLRDVSYAIKSIRSKKFNKNGLFTVGSFFRNPVVSKEQLYKIQELVPEVQYYPLDDLLYIDNEIEIKDDYVKIAAGQLIDQGLGWKGKSFGHVKISDLHALVLETDGNATPKDLSTALNAIKNAFYEKFNVEIDPEPVFI